MCGTPCAVAATAWLRATAILLLSMSGACSLHAPPPVRPLPRPAAPMPQAVPLAFPGADVEAQFEAALALMKNHQPEQAQAAFEALAHDHPQLSGALTNLGILYAQADQRDAAVARFASAVAANPYNAVAFNWLGVLQRERGDYGAAERAYRQALAAQPDYAAAQLNLGILYDIYLRRPQDAIDAYRRYRDLGGAQPMVAVWIRELEAQAGVLTAARAGVGP